MDNNSQPPNQDLNGMSQQPPAPQYQQFVPPPPPPYAQPMMAQIENPNEKSAHVLAVVGVCFAAIAAAWSFIGGACCGWAGWGFALVGLILGIISLTMKRSTIGWWTIGLSIFAVVWVFVSAIWITAGTAHAVNTAARSAAYSQGARRP